MVKIPSCMGDKAIVRLSLWACWPGPALRGQRVMEGRTLMWTLEDCHFWWNLLRQLKEMVMSTGRRGFKYLNIGHYMMYSLQGSFDGQGCLLTNRTANITEDVSQMVGSQC